MQKHDFGQDDLYDPVGDDPAVMAAVLALDQAMEAAVAKAGVILTTSVVAWVIDIGDGSHTTACMISGDASPEVLAFCTETIADEAMERPIVCGGRVLQ